MISRRKIYQFFLTISLILIKFDYETIAAASSGNSFAKDRKVTFKVIPSRLPDTSKVYITGNHAQLGDWNPGKVPLIKNTEGSWSKTFLIEDGTHLEYKITRGMWQNETVNKYGMVPPNSILEVENDTLIIIKVDNWRDSDSLRSAIKPIGKEAYKAIIQFFQYDRGIPLDARVVATEDFPDFVREKIAFNGARGNRVPGYLGIPKKGSPPYPCVLLMHSGVMEGKEIWWDEKLGYWERLVTKPLLSAGFAVLTLDGQSHGERSIHNDFVAGTTTLFQRYWIARAVDMLMESTLDYRRAIDYLATRSKFDTTRIGALGWSMGGMMTFYLTAVEPRIKASIPCTVALNIYGSLLPDVIAPWHYARGIGNRPVLMMMSRHDPFYTVEEAQQLFNLISGPTKELALYDVDGHYLSEDYVPKAVEWFQKYLKK